MSVYTIHQTVGNSKLDLYYVERDWTTFLNCKGQAISDGHTQANPSYTQASNVGNNCLCQRCLTYYDLSSIPVGETVKLVSIHYHHALFNVRLLPTKGFIFIKCPTPDYNYHNTNWVLFDFASPISALVDGTVDGNEDTILANAPFQAKLGSTVSFGIVDYDYDYLNTEPVAATGIGFTLDVADLTVTTGKFTPKVIIL